MSKKSKIGKCHICGILGKLSKEHVPPQKALNQTRAFTANGMNAVMSKAPPWINKGRKLQQHQNGIGMFTLCVPCNNNTGSWYGASFIDFTLCAFLESFQRGAIGSSLSINFRRVRPLNVIKQILAMFASVNGAGFLDKQKSLRELILNRNNMGIDKKKYKISMYINRGSIGRFLGVTGMLNSSGEQRFVSEFPASPFSYFLELDSNNCSSYCDITFFANEYSYNYETDLNLNVPILESHSPFPMDHRSQSEILKAINS